MIKKKQTYPGFSVSGLFILLVFLCRVFPVQALQQQTETVGGVVFHDVGHTGVYDPGTDIPLQGVAVSNGRDIVVTCEAGRYELEISDHTIIFVIKPSHWDVPADDHQIPRFYHIHSPNGAEGNNYAGLAPTSPLPASVDFPLYPADEPDQFEVIVFADTQPRNERELHYMVRDAVEELTGTNAAFGVTLGDLVFDDLDLFDPLNQFISTIGIPWRHIIGNHDLDFSAADNIAARGTYFRYYGPSYYSFSYGQAHFIVIDNIRFIIDGDNRYYRPEITGDHMMFIENELARIDNDQLLVLLMHIPWDDRGWNMEQRNKLFGLLSEHPNALSLGAHWHRHYHRFLGEEYGHTGSEPHHMISVGAVCGAWWRGLPDEYGIPHAMMSDGTPPGYGILFVDGSDARLHWQSSRRRADFQMHIDAPIIIAAGETDNTTISANIFNAMPDATVQMRIGENGQWTDMEYTVATDPVRERVLYYEQKIAGQTDDLPYLPTGGAGNSYKLWQADIPGRLEPGVYVIRVRAEDRWWVHEGDRIIRVVDQVHSP